ncbi:response regulator transcription factor [Rhizobium sp. P32RR-XVIII]|uniref:response regulator transcription factor n=1 Tax=Rhizobium sp. P32RR-XVIII TaxID=2726738 RepID=UPI001456647A|nr:response regulator transcription factor [Rhizobium sp. P32RR-XVIII]NLS07374.1 response regulator transcription factor [Rhizobium sp. P32RR-XVIII]
MSERKQQVPSMTSVVYVVDDDLSMREALVDLFRSMRMEAVAFESAADFLDRADLARPGCILLDVRLPGLSGLDFQAQLEQMGSRLPIIFMTGFGDIPMSVKAMKAGAVDFLTKPFRNQDILDAVTAAIERNAAERKEAAATEAVVALAQSLTPREREVMRAVVKGLMNKQIAYDLGISEITVKLHRGNVMRKMQAKSLADLVRLAEIAQTAMPGT